MPLYICVLLLEKVESLRLEQVEWGMMYDVVFILIRELRFGR
jgi:hypothetical protein